MTEYTGIMKGTGAKMKVDVQESQVIFRGALKATAPFSEVQAEARGTLVLLLYKSHQIEISVGPKAAAVAAKINRG